MERRLRRIQPAISEAQRPRETGTSLKWTERETRLHREQSTSKKKKPSSFQNAGYRAIGVRRFLDRHKM